MSWGRPKIEVTPRVQKIAARHLRVGAPLDEAALRQMCRNAINGIKLERGNPQTHEEVADTIIDAMAGAMTAYFDDVATMARALIAE